MATIYDVAKEAHVSLATVSAVVNESAYVSPALKTRVAGAIRKLGYQPNLLARSLATQRTRTLGARAPRSRATRCWWTKKQDRTKGLRTCSGSGIAGSR